MTENSEIIFDAVESVVSLPGARVEVVKYILGEDQYNKSLPEALRASLAYAGENGVVMTLPEHLHGRVVAPADHPMHRTWYTLLTEEDVGRTPQGNAVALVIQGAGAFASPNRIEQAYKEGLTNLKAGKLTDNEFHGVLEGKLPGDVEVPVYSFADFKNGVPDMPRRYVVVMDLDAVRDLPSGYQDADRLKDNPLVIARAGGVEPAGSWVDKAKAVYETDKLGNWHRFGEVDADVKQGRLVFLGDDDFDGLCGLVSLVSFGRFGGVAPEALAARETGVVTPTLDEVLAFGSHLTGDARTTFDRAATEFYQQRN